MFAGDGCEMGCGRGAGGAGWQDECFALDEQLRKIARKRSALDAEEVRWLRDAERLRVHEVMGFGSLVAYLEHVFGYTPHVALERLRVARQLGDLPEMEQALAEHRLSFSAVRELTRVTTPENQRAWLGAVAGKTAGEIAAMVAGHRRGDKPDDPGESSIVEQPHRLDLVPEALARLREVRAQLDVERGERCSDSELVLALCGAWLEQPAGGEIDRGRARYQVAITICSSCRNATVDGGGIVAPVVASTAARADCDAQRIGSIDPNAGVPRPATQDIPPATRRFIWRRDHGRCQAPGCRAARCLEVHHIVPRENGGSHDPMNLVLLCDGCHTRIHDGALTLTGSAPDALVFGHPNVARSHVGPSHSFDRAVRREELTSVLVRSGFSRREARAAVDVAMASLAPDASLEDSVRAAFRACSS